MNEQAMVKTDIQEWVDQQYRTTDYRLQVEPFEMIWRGLWDEGEQWATNFTVYLPTMSRRGTYINWRVPLDNGSFEWEYPSIFWTDALEPKCGNCPDCNSIPSGDNFNDN